MTGLCDVGGAHDVTAIDSPILVPPDVPAAPAAPQQRTTGWVIRPLTIRTTGPLLSAVAAVFTAGLLPLWIWLWQWGRVLRQDRPVVATSRSARPILLTVPLLLAGLLTAELVWMFSQGLSVGQIRSALLGHGLLIRFDHHARFIPLRLPMFWNAGLLIAYGCYWAAVRTHVGEQTRAAGISRLSTGVSFVWLAGAFCFAVAHLWWGIPLMLAGAQQRQYLTSTHRRWRPDRPVQPVICRTPRCGAALPDSARFCTRCGKART